MPAKMTLSEGIDAYLESNRLHGLKKGTLKSQRLHLMHFLTTTGNIYVHSINENHIDTLLRGKADLWTPSTVNLCRAQLAGFFTYCRRRGWMRVNYDPLFEFRRRKEPRIPRLRIPVGDFPRCLELADESHPRNRMIIGLGLFLFLRAGEMTTLRIGDVRRGIERIRVTVHKSDLVDDMPIHDNLGAELDRWFSVYSRAVGRLEPDMFLIPAVQGQPGIYDKESRRLVNPGLTPGLVRLRPNAPLAHPEKPVQRMLRAGGWPENREGCHTLRRSGARAFFDRLCEVNFQRALETVSAMLHHEQMTTTQIYLGITETQVRRDELLTGQPMFPDLMAPNVVRLDEVRVERR